MKGQRKLSVLTAATVLIVLFLSIIPNSEAHSQKKFVSYIILEEGGQVSLKAAGPLVEEFKPSIAVFETRSGYRAFYRTIHLGRKADLLPPDVDFNENIVVFLSYGEKRTSGYAVEVREMYTRRKALAIRTVLRLPPADSFQSQVITYPYILLQVSRGDYSRVELVGENGDILDFTIL
jgi:hypothetical protein